MCSAVIDAWKARGASFVEIPSTNDRVLRRRERNLVLAGVRDALNLPASGGTNEQLLQPYFVRASNALANYQCRAACLALDVLQSSSHSPDIGRQRHELPALPLCGRCALLSSLGTLAQWVSLLS